MQCQGFTNLIKQTRRFKNKIFIKKVKPELSVKATKQEANIANKSINRKAKLQKAILGFPTWTKKGA